MTPLWDLVEELREKFVGGRAYFDVLDDRLRSPGYFMAVSLLARASFGYHRAIVSGQFGEAYARWWKTWPERMAFELEPIVLPGSVRYDQRLADIECPIRGQSFVFIDDSLYLARTLDAVVRVLHNGGAALTGAAVIYDGSHRALPRVASLFRWRDR